MKVVGVRVVFFVNIFFVMNGYAVEQFALQKTEAFFVYEDIIDEYKPQTFEVALSSHQSWAEGDVYGDTHSIRGVCDEIGQRKGLAIATAQYLNQYLPESVEGATFDERLSLIQKIVANACTYVIDQYPDESLHNTFSLGLAYYDAQARQMASIHTGIAQVINVDTGGKITFKTSPTSGSFQVLCSPVVQKHDFNTQMLSLVGTSAILKALKPGVGLFYTRHTQEEISATDILRSVLPDHLFSGVLKATELWPIIRC